MDWFQGNYIPYTCCMSLKKKKTFIKRPKDGVLLFQRTLLLSVSEAALIVIITNCLANLCRLIWRKHITLFLLNPNRLVSEVHVFHTCCLAG